MNQRRREDHFCRGVAILTILIFLGLAGGVWLPEARAQASLPDSVAFCRNFTNAPTPSLPGGTLIPLYWFRIQDPDETDDWGVWIDRITVRVSLPPAYDPPRLLLQYVDMVAIAQGDGDTFDPDLDPIIGVTTIPQDRLVNGIDDNGNFIIDDEPEDYPPFEITFFIRDFVWVYPPLDIDIPSRTYWILVSFDTDVPPGTMVSIEYPYITLGDGLWLGRMYRLPVEGDYPQATYLVPPRPGDSIFHFISHPLEAREMLLIDRVPSFGSPQNSAASLFQYSHRYNLGKSGYEATRTGGVRQYQYPPEYPAFSYYFPELGNFGGSGAGPPNVLPQDSNLFPFMSMFLRGGIPNQSGGTHVPFGIESVRLSLLSLGRYDELLKDGIDQDGDNPLLSANGKDDDRDGVIDEADEGVDEEDINNELRPLRNDDIDYYVESLALSVRYPHDRTEYLMMAFPLDYTSPSNLATNWGAYDRPVDVVYWDNQDTLTYPFTLPGLLDIYDYLPNDSRIMAGSDDYPTQKLLLNDDWDCYIDDPVNADFEWPPGSGKIYPFGFLSAGGVIEGVTDIPLAQAGTAGLVGRFDPCVDMVFRDLNKSGFFEPDEDFMLFPGISGLYVNLFDEEAETILLANDDNDYFLPDGGAAAVDYPPADRLSLEFFSFQPGDEIYYDNPEQGIRFELDMGDFILSATGYPEFLIAQGTFGANGRRDWDVRLYNDDGDYFFKEGDQPFFEPRIDEVILDIIEPIGIYNFEEITEDLNDNGLYDPPVDIILHPGATRDGGFPNDGDAYSFPQPIVTSASPSIPYYPDFFANDGLTLFYSAEDGDRFNIPNGFINESQFIRDYHLLGYTVGELNRDNRTTFQGVLFTVPDARQIIAIRDTIDPYVQDPNSMVLAALRWVLWETGKPASYFIYAFDDPAGEEGKPDVIRDPANPDLILDSTDEIIYDNMRAPTQTLVDFPDEQLTDTYLVGYATEEIEFNLNPDFVGDIFDSVDFHNILSIWVDYPQSIQQGPLSLVTAALEYIGYVEGVPAQWFLFAWDDPSDLARPGLPDVIRDPNLLNRSLDKLIYDSLTIPRALAYDAGDSFVDENGNGVWDGDILLYAGENGEIDVENGDPITELVDEEVRNGFDTDGDGLTDEDCNRVPLIPLIDEDMVDFLDNDGDGLADEDPPGFAGLLPVTAELIDEEKEDDVDNDCDGMTDEDIDYIPLFRLVDEEILDYFIDRPGGREGFFDFIDLNGNGLFDPRIWVEEHYVEYGGGREIQVYVSGDVPLDEYFIDWDCDGVYDSGRADNIEGNPDEFINVLYDPAERPWLFIDDFTVYPYHQFALPVDNDGDGEIGDDQLYDVNGDTWVDFRDRYLLARPNGRDDDGDGEAGSPRDEYGRALADGIDNDGDGFVDEGIDEGFNEDIGDFAFQHWDDLNANWGGNSRPLGGLLMWLSDGDDLYDFNLDMSYNDLSMDNLAMDMYIPWYGYYLPTLQSQPYAHVRFVPRDPIPAEQPMQPFQVDLDGTEWIMTMRTGGWGPTYDNNRPGPSFGDNWSVGLFPGGVTLGRIGHAMAKYDPLDAWRISGYIIDFEPPIDVNVLPPSVQSIVLSGGGTILYAQNYRAYGGSLSLSLSQGKPQEGLITKPVYAMAFLEGITGFKASLLSTSARFGTDPHYPEVYLEPYSIDPEAGFDVGDEGGYFNFPPYTDATGPYLPLVGLNLADDFGIPHIPTALDQPESETLESLRVNIENEDLEGRGTFEPTDLNAIAEDITSGLALFRDDRIWYQFNEDWWVDDLIDEDNYNSLDDDGDGLTDEDGGGPPDNDFDPEGADSSFYYNKAADNTVEDLIPLAAVEWDPDPDDPVVRAGAHYVVLTPRNSVPLPYDDQVPINRGWDFFVVYRTTDKIDYHDAFRCWVRDGDAVFRNGRTGPGSFTNVDPVAANVPTILEDLAPPPVGGDQTTTIQADSDLTVLGFDMHDANQTFQGIESKLVAVRIWIDDVDELGRPDPSGDFNLTDIAALLPPNKAWVVVDMDTGLPLRTYRFGEYLAPGERIGSINGVALYRDENDSDNPGQFDDPFDPGIENADTPVLLSGDEEFNFVMGSTYNVYMVLDPPTYDIDIFPDLPPDLDFSPVDPFDVDPLEPLPPNNESPDYIGNDFFVVIRTSKTISYGDDFRVSIGVRSIGGVHGFTSFLFHPPLLNSGRHPFPVTRPWTLTTSFETLTNTRVLRNPVMTHMTLNDLVGLLSRQDASSPPFPVLGINVFDTQGGTETLTTVRVEVTALDGFDPLLELNPLTRDESSGIALYGDGRAISQNAVVLIYTDGSGTGNPPRDAGDMAYEAALSLGHAAVLINQDLETDQQARLELFLNTLASFPYDLVIVSQEYTDYPLRTLSVLEDYVRAGGHLIYSAVDLELVPTHPLWALMGTQFVEDLGETQSQVFWPDPAHQVASTPNALMTFSPIADPEVDNGDYVTSIGGYTTVAVGDVADPTTGLVVAADDGVSIFNGFSPIQYLPSQMFAFFQNEIQYILRAADDGVFNPDLDQPLEIVGAQYLLNYFADNPGPDGVFGLNPVTLVNDDDPRQRIGLFDEGLDEVFLDIGRGGGTVKGYLDPNDTVIDDGDNNRRDVPIGFPLYALLRQPNVNAQEENIGVQYSVYLDLVSPQQIPPDDDPATGSDGPDFYVVARTSELIDFRDKYRFRISRNGVSFSSGQSMGNTDVITHVIDTNMPTYLADNSAAFGAEIRYSTQTVAPIAIHMVNSTTDVVRLRSVSLVFESIGDYDFSFSDLSPLLTELDEEGRFISGVGLFRDDLTPERDGRDNDGDGLTDEEMLNYVDDDGDGVVDEPDWADDDPAGTVGVFDFDPVTGTSIDDFIPLAQIQLISLAANPFTRFGVEMTVSRYGLNPIGGPLAEVPHGTEFIEGAFAEADFFVAVRPSVTALAGDDFRIRIEPGRVQFRDGAYPSGESVVTGVIDMEMSVPPTFAFINPPDTAEETIFSGSSSIRWTDGDPDDDASISLYYVFEDDLVAGGPITGPMDPRLSLIAGGISEDSPINEYIWNVATERIRAGDPLHIVAIVDDGFNVPLIVVSSRVVVVNSEPFIDVTAPNTPGMQVFGTFDVTWVDRDADNEALISLYLVAEATRSYVDAQLELNGVDALPPTDVGTDFVVLVTGILESQGGAGGNYRVDVAALIEEERVALGQSYYVLAVITDLVERVVSPPPMKRILIPAFRDYSSGTVIPVLLPTVRVVEPAVPTSVNGEIFISFVGTLPEGPASDAQVELYLSLTNFGFSNEEQVEGGRDALPPEPAMIFLKLIPVQDLVFDPARPIVFSGSTTISIVELNPQAGIVGFLPWVPLGEDAYVFAQVVERPTSGGEVKSGNFSSGIFRFNEHFIRVLEPSARIPSATGIASFTVEYAVISNIPDGASPTVSLFRDLDNTGLNGKPITDTAGRLSLNLPLPPSGSAARATFEWDLTKEPLSTLFVYAILNDSADDFDEEFFDYSDGPVRIGKEVEVRSGTGAYIITGTGGVFFADGSSPKMLPPDYGVDVVRSVETAFARRGYYFLTGDGVVHSVGDTPPVVSPLFETDVAIDLEMLPRIEPAGYVLDRYGGVHPIGGAPFYGDMDFGLDIARDLEITPSGKGYVILDVFGGIHSFGDADLPPAPWTVLDSAVDIELTSTGEGYYVLVSNGTVIPVGDARPHGYAILETEARDLTISGGGAGYLVMDAYGEIRGYGEAEGTYVPAQFPQAIAQDMEKILAILFINVNTVATGVDRSADPAVGVRSDGLGAWAAWVAVGPLGRDLMLYDAAARSATPLDLSAGDQTQPAIDGDHAVWTSSVTGNRDIFFKDLSEPLSEPANLTALLPNGIQPQEQADIYGHWVVYAGYDPLGEDFDIYLLDIQPVLDGFGVEALAPPQLLTGPSVDPVNADQSAPRVFATDQDGLEIVYVVWEHLGADGLDVYLYQDATGDGFPGQADLLAGGPGNQMEPDLHAREIGYEGGVVQGTFELWAVYTENDAGDLNFFVVRFVEGRPHMALPSDPSNPSEPIDPNQQRGGSASGERITWVDQRSGFDALYMFDFLVRSPSEDESNPNGEIRFTAGNLVIPSAVNSGPWVAYLQQSGSVFTLNLAGISIDVIGPIAP